MYADKFPSEDTQRRSTLTLTAVDSNHGYRHAVLFNQLDSKPLKIFLSDLLNQINDHENVRPTIFRC
jgi:hypothetical protein